MNLKAWFKSKTADKLLAPVRELIIANIDNNSTLIDIGCGTGDLLFKAAGKIQYGLGVDLDPRMIHFANNRKQQKRDDHLDFIQQDATLLTRYTDQIFDIATSTLCLHEMNETDAINTLRLLANHSKTLLIADYAPPKSLWAQFTIELDEFISGHYQNFRRYRNRGGMPYLANKAGLTSDTILETAIDGIYIWKLSAK